MLLSFCRLNAGFQHAIDDSEHKTALYMQAKADKRLNLTFPPVKSQGTTVALNEDRLGYSFSGWSDSPVSSLSWQKIDTVKLSSFFTCFCHYYMALGVKPVEFATNNCDCYLIWEKLNCRDIEVVKTCQDFPSFKAL